MQIVEFFFYLWWMNNYFGNAKIKKFKTYMLDYTCIEQEKMYQASGVRDNYSLNKYSFSTSEVCAFPNILYLELFFINV